MPYRLYYYSFIDEETKAQKTKMPNFKYLIGEGAKTESVFLNLY